MKRLVLSVVLSGILFSATMGTEEEIQAIIASSEQLTQLTSPDAKALIKSLTTGSNKSTIRMTKILPDKSAKACHSKGRIGVSMNDDMHVNEPLGRCGMSHKLPELRYNRCEKTSAQLFIFVSSSMPPQSIKVLGQGAQKIGARVVFRGLIGGTFKETQNYMKDLGIVVDIDPPKFDDYQVTLVPTFILIHNKKVDRVSGHISLWEALDQFRRKGDLKPEAKELYRLFQQDSPQEGRS